MRKTASHLIPSAESKRQDMAGKKVRELDGSWSAMKSYNRKCEDFIGNMDPLKGSKAGKGHNQISF